MKLPSCQRNDPEGSRMTIPRPRLVGFALNAIFCFALTSFFPINAQAQEKVSESVTPVADADSKEFVERIQKSIESAIALSEHSVVAIARVRRESQSRAQVMRFPGLPGMGVLAGGRLDDPDFIPNEYATGVVIDDQGHILTNYHALGDPRQNDYFIWSAKHPLAATVVSPLPSEAEPPASDNEPLQAEVSAGDPFTDLAILKVETTRLVPIKFGDSAKVKKGQIVVALANPYAIARDGEMSASWGIISNIGRSATAKPGQTSTPQDKETLHHYGSLLQTDAKLSVGCSGGALINLDGEMVGLITSATALQGMEEAAGFAIPVDETFQRVIETLKQGRLPDFGFLGIIPDNLPEGMLQKYAKGDEIQGALVRTKVIGLPGDLAGLREGDIITAVNGNRVEDRNSLFLWLSRQPAEAKVQLTVMRPQSSYGVLQELKLTAQLSKKFVATSIPAYSKNPMTSWRGLVVEYATALPTEMSRLTSRLQSNPPKLAALQVDPNTPAWNAGLRPGQGIIKAGDRVLQNPDEFYDLVRATPGKVSVTIIDANDQLQTVSIEPE